MAQTPNAVKAGATPGAGWLQRRFGRRTTSGEFIPVIDGIRFIAISLVVFLHVTAGLWARDRATVDAAGFRLSMAIPGQFGVHLFFVVSGLILAIPFTRRLIGGPPVSLRRYYVRRLTRLEPPYLLALTGFFVIDSLFGPGSFSELTPHYLSGLFYAHGFVFHTVNPVNEVLWSLEVEVQFYVVMPLLASVYLLTNRTIRRSMLLGAIVAATGLAYLLTIGDRPPGQAGQPLTWAYITLPANLNFFLLGMLIADLMVHDWERRTPSVAADVIVIAGLVGLFLLDPSFGIQRMLLVPLCCALIVAGAIRGRFVRSLFERPVIFVIGGMCYSIYLMHFGVVRLFGYPVSEGIAPSSPLTDFLVSSVVLTGACLIVSAVYYLLIERPCMWPDWPRRLRGRILTARPGPDVSS